LLTQAMGRMDHHPSELTPAQQSDHVRPSEAFMEWAA